ncbi:Conserved_hypothetical protein [Hexamita inflata]|uniref:Uncharacterized protein n=1 Tax=Hexamita inflata TaxID=28002 RepID=A0AA86U398_9EUKA|nr:Conserved hypothetical protein [Hexamita inflata]
MSITQLLENIDNEMIQSYKNKIIDDVLFIHMGFYLKNIEFMEHLNIKALKLQLCTNVVPKLRSKTVKDLKLIYCKIQNLQEMELDNLESLFLQEEQKKLEDNALTQSITKLQNLQKLRLDGYRNLDIKPLNVMKQLQTLELNTCQLKQIDDIKELNQLKELIINYCGLVQLTALKYFMQLTKLSLISCGLVNLDQLVSLTNLEKLYINNNKGVDITQVQHLSQLAVLHMNECGLQILDALRPLVNLNELNIRYNQIIYVQPLAELKQLTVLNAEVNCILDASTIENNPNFRSFNMIIQNQPSKEQLSIANVLRNTNYPVTLLRQMRSLKFNFKATQIVQKQNIEQFMLQYYQRQVSFSNQVSSLFTEMSKFEYSQ